MTTTKILDYSRQPDAVTCQSTAIAKVTGGDIMTIRNALLQNGAAGDPYNMGDYLKPRVKQYKYLPQGNLNELVEWVTQGVGYEAIVHGFTTNSGHVWGVETAIPEDKVFICDDPWAEFDFPGERYLNKSGKNVAYSYRAMWAYTVASWSFPQAREAYIGTRSKAFDMNQRGGWFHLVQN